MAAADRIDGELDDLASWLENLAESLNREIREMIPAAHDLRRLRGEVSETLGTATQDSGGLHLAFTRVLSDHRIAQDDRRCTCGEVTSTTGAYRPDIDHAAHAATALLDALAEHQQA